MSALPLGRNWWRLVGCGEMRRGKNRRDGTRADRAALDARLTEIERSPLEKVYRGVFQLVLERVGNPVVVEGSEAEMTPWRT